jgi:RNA polymerase sigma-70 factor (ECF subfamily)
MTRQHTAQATSEASFEELVRPYLRALFTLAWRFTHNTALAQDLVQDTLLKAYRFLHRFEAGTNFWAWLVTIMRNLYFSQRRKQAWEIPVLEVDRLPLLADPFPTENPEVRGPEDLSEILPYMVTDDVLQALDNLPDEYRTTVLLADLLDYSYKDIAAVMECPIGTVMSRLHRGRQLLQRRLQQYALDQGYLPRTSQAQTDGSPTVSEALREQLACA